MTKAQLLVIASELGVEGLNEKTLKAEMISAILNALEVESNDNS